MKFFRLDLLTLLISLFILNSCKNQDAVGLGSNGPGQINGALVDTSTIIVNTVLEDSVVTYSSGGALPKNPLAYFTDPIFGVTVSNLATDISLPGSAAYTLPSGVISIDSALLVLKLADGFYGDSLTSNYTVNVYQLQSKFNSSTNYYNTANFGTYTSSPLIGSRSFNGVKPKDSISIFDIVTGAPDTLMKVPPQLRIPINPSFITTNLLNASSTTLSSNAIFQNIVKGLYITLDQKKTTGPGGAFMISPSDSIAVYYKANNGGIIDTAVIYLPVSNFAASIQHNYTAIINTELNNTTSSRNLFYLQGLGGLRAKVSFPNFLANLRAGLLKKDSDIVINRAELVITPNIGYSSPYIPATDKPYSPIPKLTMYRLDIAHQRAQIEDASSGDPRAFGVGSFGGYYYPPGKQYHFLLTAYLQDQLLNKTVDYGTYIAPIDTTNTTSVDIAATPQIAARTVAVGTNKTAPLSQYQIRLNVIYTRVSLK
jgi:hypothetical protein